MSVRMGVYRLYYRLDLDVVLNRVIQEPHLDDLTKRASLRTAAVPNRPRHFGEAVPQGDMIGNVILYRRDDGRL